MLYVYIGCIIEQRLMGTYKYALWQDTDFRTSCIRTVVLGMMTLPLLLTDYISRNHPPWVLILVRVIIPQSILNIFWFGPAKYILI